MQQARAEKTGGRKLKCVMAQEFRVRRSVFEVAQPTGLLLDRLPEDGKNLES
jgi:hypothetical protein